MHPSDRTACQLVFRSSSQGCLRGTSRNLSSKPNLAMTVSIKWQGVRGLALLDWHCP
jgi:hypothetical protein